MFIDQKPKVAKISCKIVPLVLFEQDAKNPHDQVNVPVKTSTLSSESYKYGVSRIGENFFDKSHTKVFLTLKRQF